MNRRLFLFQTLLLGPLILAGLILNTQTAAAEPTAPPATSVPATAAPTNTGVETQNPLEGLVTGASTSAVAPSTGGGGTCQTLDLRKIEPCLDPSTTSQTWVKDIWQWSLGVVNIFAALVLIFMAFANILYPWQALEQYRIRQLLPTFIWGVILANLSMFFCRAIVSAADLLMSNGGFTFAMPEIYDKVFGIDTSKLDSGVIAAKFAEPANKNPFVMLYQLIASTVLVYLPIIALAILAFIFYLRFALILFLSAISPLAFGAIIFPITRQYLNRWWDTFWKWTFGGVASYLLMFIAVRIAESAFNQESNNASFAINIIPYALGIILTVLAIQAPFKLGGAIASAYVGLTRRGLGYGVNAAKTGYNVGKWGTDVAKFQAAKHMVRGQELMKDYDKKGFWGKTYAQLQSKSGQLIYGGLHLNEQQKEAREQREKQFAITRQRAAGQSWSRQKMQQLYLKDDAIKTFYTGHDDYQKDMTATQLASHLSDANKDGWMDTLSREERQALLTKNVSGIKKLQQRLARQGKYKSLNDLGSAGNALIRFQDKKYQLVRGDNDDPVGDAMKIAAGEPLPKKQTRQNQGQGIGGPFRGRGRGNATIGQAGAPAGGAQAYGSSPSPQSPPFGGRAAAVRPILSDANVQNSTQVARSGSRLFARRTAVPIATAEISSIPLTAASTGPRLSARGAVPLQGVTQLRPIPSATIATAAAIPPPQVAFTDKTTVKPFRIPSPPSPQSQVIKNQPAKIQVFERAKPLPPPPTPKIIEQLQTARSAQSTPNTPSNPPTITSQTQPVQPTPAGSQQAQVQQAKAQAERQAQKQKFQELTDKLVTPPPPPRVSAQTASTPNPNPPRPSDLQNLSFDELSDLPAKFDVTEEMTRRIQTAQASNRSAGDAFDQMLKNKYNPPPLPPSKPNP